MANQKGGVGKSTTAVSLGAALAELGYQVLVIDLDPQGNASTGLGIRHDSRDVTVYDVLAAEAPIAAAIVQTPVPNLFAIPSTIDLAGAEIELVSQFSRELRLRKAIEPLHESGYDFVFLDCPPSLGLLTINALAAAEELIVPIQCEYYALEGLGQLLRNVRLVQQNVNPGLRLDGIVMTMFDPRTRLSEQVVAEVRRFFGERVYQTIIPRTVRLSEAPGFGQPITVYDPRSKGAECYRDLAREVATRKPIDEPMPVFEEVPTLSIPAPEPHVMTAPRPLSRVSEEEAEGEGEDEVGETLAVAEAAVEMAPVEQTPDQLAERPIPQAEVEARAVPARPQPSAAELVDLEPGGSVSDGEAQVEGIEPEVELESQPPSRTTPEDARGSAPGDARPEVAPRIHTSPIVMVAEADGRTGRGGELAPGGEAAGKEEPKKRRWSLFRRGGKR